jgi:peptidylprolyl isomerase
LNRFALLKHNTMYLRRIFSSLILLSFLCCSSNQSHDSIILIETGAGSIKIKLYNDTPIHRDNFLKLIKSGFYDSLLFHRVIKEFMIQGGDPTSKNAAPGALLGEGDAGYTLQSEILPNHFHHRGVLAAAREGDEVNPSRRSSGAQFYIVQGKKFTDDELTSLAVKLNARNFQLLANQIAKSLTDSISKIQVKLPTDSIRNLVYLKATKVFKPFIFSEEQKKVYKQIGGVPHLDGAYTIYGEVIEGLDVVEKISLLPTDANNRPLQDLKMQIKIIR